VAGVTPPFIPLRLPCFPLSFRLIPPKAPHHIPPDSPQGGLSFPCGLLYACGMYPALEHRSHAIVLLLGPAALYQAGLHHWLARQACAQGVHVIDCGNHFNAYLLARLIRRQTHLLEAALARVQVARTFTCYQAVSQLAETPPQDAPGLIMGLLASFYDENISLPEGLRLLEIVQGHLHRLSQQAPLIVQAAHPPANAAARAVYPEYLAENASLVLHPAAAPSVHQPNLF